MKNIIFILALSFSLIANAQAPLIKQYISPKGVMALFRDQWGSDSAALLLGLHDTSFTPTRLGMIIFRTADSTAYISNSIWGPGHWIKLGSGSGSSVFVDSLLGFASGGTPSGGGGFTSTDTTVIATHYWTNTQLANKQNTITLGLSTQYFDGTLTPQDFNTSVFNALTFVTYSSPLTYSSNTLSIAKSTSSIDGYLGASDFTKFLQGYNKSVAQVLVSGTSTKTLNLTTADGTIYTTSWTDLQGTGGGGAGNIKSIDGDSTITQTFTTDTSGTDFNITTNGTGTTVWNIPTWSHTNRGVGSTTDWDYLHSRMGYTDTASELAPIHTDISNRMKYTDTTLAFSKLIIGPAYGEFLSGRFLGVDTSQTKIATVWRARFMADSISKTRDTIYTGYGIIANTDSSFRVDTTLIGTVYQLNKDTSTLLSKIAFRNTSAARDTVMVDYIDVTKNTTANGYSHLSGYPTYQTETIFANGIQINSTWTTAWDGSLLTTSPAIIGSDDAEQVLTLKTGVLNTGAAVDISFNGANLVFNQGQHIIWSILTGNLRANYYNFDGTIGTVPFNVVTGDEIILKVRRRFHFLYIFCDDITQGKSYSTILNVKAADNTAIITTISPAFSVQGGVYVVEGFKTIDRGYHADAAFVGSSITQTENGNVYYDSSLVGRMNLYTGLKWTSFSKSSSRLIDIINILPEIKKMKPQRIVAELGFNNAGPDGQTPNQYVPQMHTIVDSLLKWGIQVYLFRVTPSTTYDVSGLNNAIDTAFGNGKYPNVFIINMYNTTSLYSVGGTNHGNSSFLLDGIHFNAQGTLELAWGVINQMKPALAPLNFANLLKSIDSTTYKPVATDGNGNTVRLNYWPGSGGTPGITGFTASGDATGTYAAGNIPLTLNTVNSNVFGSNTFLKFAVNAKGLVTSAAAVVAGDIPNLAESQITNLSTDLSAKAPLASPTFTGTVSAPTPTAGDNSTKVATTAFVTNAIPIVSDGTYTPVATGGTSSNNAAVTFYACKYIKVGSTIIVSGGINLRATTAGTLENISISLPFTGTTFTSFQHCSGSGATTENGDIIDITSDLSTTNMAKLTIANPATNTNHSYTFTFMYQLQ